MIPEVIHTNTDNSTGPPALAGGQHGARLVDRTVLYSKPHRRTRTKRRQSECIRMRITFERQVVMGHYETTQGHREPDSIRNRIIHAHWDATVCEDAIRHARERITRRKSQGPHLGLKSFAIVAVANALQEHNAPVNHHTATALLEVFELSCSRMWFNQTLRKAGWVPIRADEMPNNAPGFNMVNWRPDGA